MSEVARTHMMLQVEVGGRRWLADVGFGSEGLLLPVPFGGGEVSRQHGWTFRVVNETHPSSYFILRGGGSLAIAPRVS